MLISKKVLGCLVVIVVAGMGCESNLTGSRNTVLERTSWPASFGFGRIASAEEIAELDHDVRPDGKGLPIGSGTFAVGKALYTEKCSRCHGANGFEGPFNKLVDDPFGKDDAKTIGNYWPYATTVFDYVNRTMPYDAPGSLTPDEVYSVTLFLLARNNLVDSTIVLDSSNLAKVFMPVQKQFVTDDREQTSTVR